jgi:hypothetical protein
MQKEVQNQNQDDQGSKVVVYYVLDNYEEQ